MPVGAAEDAVAEAVERGDGGERGGAEARLMRHQIARLHRACGRERPRSAGTKGG